MKQAFYYDTIIGQVWFVSADGFLTNLVFGAPPGEVEVMESAIIWEAYLQLREYLQSGRVSFDIPLKFQGTPFMSKVWDAIRSIPYGETRTYRDIARMTGNEKAVRAVGLANHYNPLAIIIPCHRVVGEQGKLVGYTGGINIKRKLLEIENRRRFNPGAFFPS